MNLGQASKFEFPCSKRYLPVISCVLFDAVRVRTRER
jgi:hypothetical protein